ncbi:MAG: type II and III secretion system protein family protein [Gammaproteobacteria bacterium]|nr:type II and III secretion system protein family protein [Gammaproteobacteria bacterium]
MQFINAGKPISIRIAFVVLFLLSGLISPAHATVRDLVFGNALDHLEVPLNQSRILVFNDAIENVAVGNPAIADIVVLESKKLYVLGKSLGTTNVVVWGKNRAGIQEHSTLNIDIVHDIDSLKHHLHELFPNEKPQIRSAQGSLIISGEISSTAKVEAITNLATQFVRNAKKYNAVSKDAEADNKQDIEVINLMQVGGPHQVMLEVKIAEVSRTVLKRLGINLAAYSPGSPFKLGAVNGGATFPKTLTTEGYQIPMRFDGQGSVYSGTNSIVGPYVQSFSQEMPVINAAGLFASFLSPTSYFNLVLDASRDDGLAKILAEPTLTSMSGESAEFLSGGEFPIPIWNDKQGAEKIFFKNFGVNVKMLPVVLDSKRINLNLNVGVSEISRTADIALTVPGSNVVYNIPSLTTRSASSTIELMDGQTIGIAGLISDKMRETINKFPGLGDVPVLGALFRSQEYVQDQTELVMFVTAHLAKTIDPSDIKLPTDAFSTPNDAEFFLFGRMADDPEDNTLAFGGKVFQKPHRTNVKYPKQLQGPTFGHQL